MVNVGLSSARPWLLAVLLLAVAVLSTGAVRAGTDPARTKSDGKDPATSGVQQVLDDVTPLTELSYETSYGGVASFRQKQYRGSSAFAPNGHEENYEHLDELQNAVEFTHRFHLFDKVYLKLGASYERFDFSVTDAPLPSSLQSLNGVVALELIVRGNVATFITSSPGVYFSQFGSIGVGNFDAPTAIGTAFKIPGFPQVYGLIGARFSALSNYPVYPIAGIVWVVRDDFKFKLVPPEPRVVYNYSDQLDFIIGAELLGESYKRDFNDDYRPQFKKFSGGVINYSETRIGAGVTYKPFKGVEIDVRGGWDLGRSFDYYRGDSKRFTTHGAPYAKLGVSAEF